MRWISEVYQNAMVNLWEMGQMLFFGGLFIACIMDIKEHMVYRFLWLISGAGALLMGVVYGCTQGLTIEGMIELVFFVMIQQLWFSRFYGRADCHAYSVCAAAMTAYGLQLIDYVMHMLLTFGGLFIVQAVRRNITGGGRLKKPVALIPYLTVAFVVWVDFRCRKWYI